MNVLHLYSQPSETEIIKRIIPYISNSFNHTFADCSNLNNSTNLPDVIHAHSWQTGINIRDFAIKNHIPFIVSLTQNDIVSFKKSFILSKKKYYTALKDASKVIFTNFYQQDFVADNLPSDVANAIFEHSVLFIESAREFWLKNIHSHQPTGLVNIKLLYIGSVSEDADISLILSAIDKLKSMNYPVSLTAVEIFGSYIGKFQKIASKRDDFQIVNIESLESESSLNKILEIIRNLDIAILLNENPQSLEPFIAACTQGLPIIHAKKSPFDGFFSDKFTNFTLSSNNSSELAKLILNIGNSYATIEQHIAQYQPFIMFNPREIAYKYEHLYDNTFTKYSQK